MSVPKAELHVHVEGAASPDLVRRIAARNRVARARRRLHRGRALPLERLPRLPHHLRRRHERHPHRRGLPRHRLRVPGRLRRRGRDLRRADRVGRPRRRRRAVRRGTPRRARPGHRRRPRRDRDRGAHRHELRAPLRPGEGARGRAADRRGPAPLRHRLRHGRRRGRLPARRLRRRVRDRPRGRARPDRPRRRVGGPRERPRRPRAGGQPDRPRRPRHRGSRARARACGPGNGARGMSHVECRARPLPELRGAPAARAARRRGAGHARLGRPAVLGCVDRRRVRGGRRAHGLRRRGAARGHEDRAPCGIRRGGCSAAAPRVWSRLRRTGSWP